MFTIYILPCSYVVPIRFQYISEYERTIGTKAKTENIERHIADTNMPKLILRATSVPLYILKILHIC